MYQTFFIITSKEFVKLLKYTVTMVMDAYDRNLTTFQPVLDESICYSYLST